MLVRKAFPDDIGEMAIFDSLFEREPYKILDIEKSGRGHVGLIKFKGGTATDKPWEEILKIPLSKLKVIVEEEDNAE